MVEPGFEFRQPNARSDAFNHYTQLSAASKEIIQKESDRTSISMKSPKSKIPDRHLDTLNAF